MFSDFMEEVDNFIVGTSNVSVEGLCSNCTVAISNFGNNVVDDGNGVAIMFRCKHVDEPMH